MEANKSKMGRTGRRVKHKTRPSKKYVAQSYLECNKKKVAQEWKKNTHGQY